MKLPAFLLPIVLAASGCLAPDDLAAAGAQESAAPPEAAAWEDMTFDYSFRAGASETHEETFVVPEGLGGTLVLRAETESDAGLPVQSSRRETTLRLTTPSGEGECAAKSDSLVSLNAPRKQDFCNMEHDATPGAWSLLVEGEGDLRLRVTITRE